MVAIDNGSQSTKVSVVDGHGRVHASARRPLRPYEHPAPGHVVHPGDDVWESIAGACREALGAFTGDRDAIIGVGLCTIRFCRARLGPDGLLAGPMLSWMDSRVGRPHEPDPEVRYVTTSSGYITRRLTGEHRDAAANYQGLWPIDTATWRWSVEPGAYERTGMPPDMLFELVDPGGSLGKITPRAAETTGMPAGIPVYATANDKAVEALGCGLAGSDTVLVSLGTYIAAMTTTDREEPADPRYWINFAAEPGRYLVESNGIRRGMWTVSWLRDLLGADLDALTREAAAVEPGSGGLITVLDWLAPADHPYRRGAILGFDGTQGRGHLYRSLLEAIALTMRRHVRAMEAALGQTFSTVVVSGGGSHSPLVMQLFADVFDRPAARAGVSDAAGVGAAICAAVGAGLHPGWEAAVAAMVRPGVTYHPDPDAARRYVDLAADHDAVPSFTDPLFAALSAARGRH
ncbi:MAG: FGGY-family carbohydrate kinase [Nakamurella sp.]